MELQQAQIQQVEVKTGTLIFECQGDWTADTLQTFTLGQFEVVISSGQDQKAVIQLQLLIHIDTDQKHNGKNGPGNRPCLPFAWHKGG